MIRAAAIGLALFAVPALAQTVAVDGDLNCRALAQAAYDAPTTRYPHGVLGDTIEWGALRLTYSFICAGGVDSSDTTVTITLPDELVFEDVAPRIVPPAAMGAQAIFGGAGILVVESHRDLGARLALWSVSAEGAATRAASTPFIGQRFRWLAPLGFADLDGDGLTEFPFVDRPHLAKTLRIWRYDAGDLTLVASLPGVTNHRIGERDIAGGIRDCGQGPEMLVASADWSQMLAVTFSNGTLTARPIGTDTSRPAFARALACG